MIKNNVTRLLEAKGISFQACELPGEKLSAVEAAQYLDVDPQEVFKTIVVIREMRGKPILALVPATREVDLKALSRALGEKKVHLATQKQAENLTGLQVGGISPLALLNHGFQVVLDDSACSLDQIYISGGQRSLDIRLRWEDLVDLTGAETAAIGR